MRKVTHGERVSAPKGSSPSPRLGRTGPCIRCMPRQPGRPLVARPVRSANAAHFSSLWPQERRGGSGGTAAGGGGGKGSGGGGGGGSTSFLERMGIHEIDKSH
jgi:hypothetical protein